jgi:hypothetical protein
MKPYYRNWLPTIAHAANDLSALFHEDHSLNSPVQSIVILSICISKTSPLPILSSNLPDARTMEKDLGIQNDIVVERTKEM